MPVHVKCPQCGQVGIIKEARPGARFHCAKCGHHIVLAATPTTTAAPPTTIPVDQAIPTPQGADAKPPSRVDGLLHPKAPAGPVGIGGWLLLPAIGLVLSIAATPLRIYNLHTELELSRYTFSFSEAGDLSVSSSPATEGEQGYERWAIVINSLWGVFMLYVAIRFFQQHPSVPKLMIALMVTRVVLVLVDQCWVSSVFGAASAVPVIGSVSMAAVWIPYFLVSKRVKATFNPNRYQELKTAPDSDMPTRQPPVLGAPAECINCGMYLREGLRWNELPPAKSSPECSVKAHLRDVVVVRPAEATP